jgi:hypothetical protein
MQIIDYKYIIKSGNSHLLSSTLIYSQKLRTFSLIYSPILSYTLHHIPITLIYAHKTITPDSYRDYHLLPIAIGITTYNY